jgi:hypothetical protein
MSFVPELPAGLVARGFMLALRRAGVSLRRDKSESHRSCDANLSYRRTNMRGRIGFAIPSPR